tara:strand:- start:59 stop:838 length:780 start_codon:yes stop_codon:yes gene_type:complete
MEQNFYKYQGTGNDFILIDDRLLNFPEKDVSLIARLCDRRFGIGADGLILIQNAVASDFKMVYFNADGNEGTLCGNGARCTIAFAYFLNCIEDRTTFEAVDGLHSAHIVSDIISLQMHDVNEIQAFENHIFLDTGSPHHIQMVEELKTFDVYANGKRIREGSPYFKAGTNVNFVEQMDDDRFAIRTYERGVEEETLSCGTGATAVALAMHQNKKTTATKIKINVQGGILEIQFKFTDNVYSQIYLSGPVEQVYCGTFKF